MPHPPNRIGILCLFCLFGGLGVLGACHRSPRHQETIEARSLVSTLLTSPRPALDPALPGAIRPSTPPPRDLRDLRDARKARVFTPKKRTGPACRLIKLLSPIDLHVKSIDPAVFGGMTDRVFAAVERPLTPDPTPRDVLVQVVYHRDRAPDLTVAARPRLNPATVHVLHAQLRMLKVYHPKQLDFPVLYRTCTHGGATDQQQVYVPELPPPHARIEERLARLSLGRQLRAIRDWAWEVIPIVAAILQEVDAKYEGVRNMGAALARLKPGDPVDVDRLTLKSNDFWRALLEMAQRKEIIPAVRALLLMAAGRLDWAWHLVFAHSLMAAPDSISGYLFGEMIWRLRRFDRTLMARLSVGVKRHDAKRYAAAIRVYEGILRDYPDSGLTRWEHHLSTRMMHLAKGTRRWDHHRAWLKDRPRIYAADPLFHIFGSAKNAREAYEILQRMELKELFQTRNAVPDLLKQADIAVDLGLFGFAALVYWTLQKNVAPAAYQPRKLYVDFLYALEKLGMTHFKNHFKGDHAAAFRAIDAARHKRFVEDPLYKGYCDKGDGKPRDPSCKLRDQVDIEIRKLHPGGGGEAYIRTRAAPAPSPSAR